MKRTAIVIALAAVTLTGCVQRVADFTVASTKNMEINHTSFIKGSRVTGDDMKAILLLPLGVPNVKEAADKAIEQDRCSVGLSDVTVEFGFFSFLVGAQWYTVEGDQIIDTAISGCENWVPTPKVVKKVAPTSRRNTNW
jgi:hypothetical protein